MNFIVEQMLKRAFATYNYGASRSRNFTPKKVAKPETIQQDTGEVVKKAIMPDAQSLQLPKPGKNKPMGKWYSEFEFTHSFAPTISGTGSGHQYWQDKRNPYEV